ncbi:MAG TPA: energy transducer TonB [Polyangiaceae bacterium]|nr:energy transducer TonB [Polyangiaceae bacterium]
MAQSISNEHEIPDSCSQLDRTPAPVVRGPAPARHSGQSHWEVAAIVGISTLLHAGAAAKAFQGGDAQLTPKRVSRVEIEMVRPPPPPVIPPKPLVLPPPPRPAPAKAVEKVKLQVPRPEPVASPPPEPAPEPPDTGSSSPADAEGTLHAGAGGLGVEAPAPPLPVVLAPAAPAPIIQAREGANYLKNPRPEYPGRARREGWQGTAVLRVQVSPQGKPGAIAVQRSSGRELLDEAAIEAVKAWSFVPATQAGEPIAGWVTVPIVFQLQ